jgi:transposase
VAELFAMLEKELPRISGKSNLAEAIRYTLSRRTALAGWHYQSPPSLEMSIVSNE